MPEAGETDVPLILARGLSKEFNGRRVLDDFDLEIRPGEIHGFVGQNGSGKSTLIKILAGYHSPDPGGSLEVNGESLRLPLRADDPSRVGISFVHQDLGFLQTGTVVENFRIGRYKAGFAGRISWRRERQATTEALERFGIHIHPERQVSTLTPVDQAMVAIARSVDQLRRYSDAQDKQGQERSGGLLVLDEPTSYLPRDGVDRLFAAMRSAAAAGSAILFVSHRLAEVLAVTDRVTVIRGGKKVGTFATSTLTEDQLVHHILGFSLDALYPEPHATTQEVVATARNVSGDGVDDFSLDIHRGEVVGLTGLAGMGHERVPYLMFGAGAATSGTVSVGDVAQPLTSLTPGKAIRMGLAFLPGDRTRESGAPTATAAENMMLPSLRSLTKRGFLSSGTIARASHRVMGSFNVVPREPQLPFASFSGGNQQKALVGKWVETNPLCFLMIEPTQGVDVGAKKHIFEAVRNVAIQGVPIVIVSTEYKDLAHLCDRVVVFSYGKAISELRGANLTEERIVEQCFAGSGQRFNAA